MSQQPGGLLWVTSLRSQHHCSVAELKVSESFATSSLKTASAQRTMEGMVDRWKKHIQNYLLTNDAENVMNKYPFLDLLL